MNYRQLVNLLRRYEFALYIENIDLVQVLLILANKIDWVKKQALKLIRNAQLDKKYWEIVA